MARMSLVLALTFHAVSALRYMEKYADYNLNSNETASSVLDYWGQWEDHDYTPSPDNWRFPVYTIMLDRFVNGDPTNDNANGTLFEHDLDSNQIRNGGDIQGLVDTLDYLQGMGVKVCITRGPNGRNADCGTGDLSGRPATNQSTLGI